MSQITIRIAEAGDIPAARQVILTVAKNIFHWQRSIEEIACMMTQDGELGDLDDLQAYYFDQRGIFMVALDGDRIIGTGGIHAISKDQCELKRLWLLEEYHGKGIGYQITMQLLDYARNNEFKLVTLKTSPLQVRAIDFYMRLGFNQDRDQSTEGDLIFVMPL